ncbi:ankyrin repeat-containing domain protein, partial [Blyttiomyces helicus]
ATRSGQVEVLRYLLEIQHLSPTTKTYALETPLHLSAHHPIPSIPALLIAHGADVNGRDAVLETPLHYASRHGTDRTIALLLSHSADPNAQSTTLTSPLHLARDPETVSALLAHPDTNPNLASRTGTTPILYHAQHAATPTVLAILAHSATDPRAADVGGRTLLHLACFRGYGDIVEALLTRGGVDIESRTLRGNAPLHAASDAGHLDIVGMLLRAGADPRVRNGQGKRAGDLARNEAVREILDGERLVGVTATVCPVCVCVCRAGDECRTGKGSDVLKTRVESNALPRRLPSRPYYRLYPLPHSQFPQ